MKNENCADHILFFYSSLDICTNYIVIISLTHSHCPLNLREDDDLQISYVKKVKPALLQPADLCA